MACRPAVAEKSESMSFGCWSWEEKADWKVDISVAEKEVWMTLVWVNFEEMIWEKLCVVACEPCPPD
jgi:hypothetical protein